jgi:hypothetical protein
MGCAAVRPRSTDRTAMQIISESRHKRIRTKRLRRRSAENALMLCVYVSCVSAVYVHGAVRNTQRGSWLFIGRRMEYVCCLLHAFNTFLSFFPCSTWADSQCTRDGHVCAAIDLHLHRLIIVPISFVDGNLEEHLQYREFGTHAASCAIVPAIETFDLPPDGVSVLYCYLSAAASLPPLRPTAAGAGASLRPVLGAWSSLRQIYRSGVGATAPDGGVDGRRGGLACASGAGFGAMAI